MVKIQSFSDIITNSSSEVFILDSGAEFLQDIKCAVEAVARKAYIWESDSLSEEDGEKLLMEDLKKQFPQYDSCSGNGGDIDIDLVKCDDGKNRVKINIDWARRHTLCFILNNFNIYDRYY